MSYWDTNGLLNSNFNENGGENSMLYTYEYLLLYKLCYNSLPREYLIYLNSIIKCEKKPGLFNQHPTNNDFMSHDNLTSIICASENFDLNLTRTIWKEIKRQGYIKYDNINPDKPKRWLHPRDIIFYGILNNNIICYLLFPILLIMMLITLMGDKQFTCGKILWFIRIYSTKKILLNLLFKPIYDILLKKKYGKYPLIEIFNIYFPEKNNPIHRLTRKYYGF